MSTAEHEERKDAEQPACCANHANNSLSTPAANSTVLAELKNEILNSINQERRSPLPWGSVTISIVLGLLALISVVQAVQSASLYGKLKSGNLNSAAGSAATSPANGSATSLPNQVGGC